MTSSIYDHDLFIQPVALPVDTAQLIQFDWNITHSDQTVTEGLLTINSEEGGIFLPVDDSGQIMVYVPTVLHHIIFTQEFDIVYNEDGSISIAAPQTEEEPHHNSHAQLNKPKERDEEDAAEIRGDYNRKTDPFYGLEIQE